ncbi:MAG: serine hydrolase [Oscillospiraceae bacterium]|nr:serine hydrolase [Oscillospiraceae bacterium]
MKKLLSALVALLIFVSIFTPGVFAAQAAEEETAENAIDFSRFEGKTAGDVVEAFLNEWGIKRDSLTLGYYNTVTGEEYYLNGNKYMVAASVYKLPLNMYYSEKVYLGEMDWSTRFQNVTYEDIQTSSIISSNNELSEILQEAIGSYRDYRTAIAPYVGVNTHTVEERYYQGNDFTARQIITALKKLYNEPERYPRVLDYMLKAAPDNYFSYEEHRYDIAHKYGYLKYDGHRIVNDAAIVYTPDPILLVMFSDNSYNAIGVMSAYCSLMCDYSEYTRYLRESGQLETEEEVEVTPEPTPEVEASPEPTPEATPEVTAAPTPVPTPALTVVPAVDTTKAEKVEFEFTKIHALAIFAAAAGILSLVFFLLKKLRPASKVIAIILLMVFGIAFVALCTIAVGNAINGTLFPEKDDAPVAPPPAEVVDTPNLPAETPQQIPDKVMPTEYVVSDESAEEILNLAQFAGTLKYVDGKASEEYAALYELNTLLPECTVEYTVELYGLELSNDIESLRIEDFSIMDPEPLMEKLEYLPNLKTLDIEELWFSNETVEAIMEKYPEIDIIWTVNVGDWTISSEILCFSTQQGDNPKYRYTSEELAPIFKHCTELVALDLSHNDISSLEGIENLTKLQVLLLGDNTNIVDISPLAELTELQYLELYQADTTDFSPLLSLEKLTDLNLSYCWGLENCDFLDVLPNLERVWMRSTAIPAELWEKTIYKYNDIKILFWHESAGAEVGGWKNHEKTRILTEAFRNWDYVEEFTSWDNISYTDTDNLY